MNCFSSISDTAKRISPVHKSTVLVHLPLCLTFWGAYTAVTGDILAHEGSRLYTLLFALATTVDRYPSGPQFAMAE